MFSSIDMRDDEAGTTAYTSDGRIAGRWFAPYMAAPGHGFVNPIPSRWDDVVDSHGTDGRLLPRTRIRVHSTEAFVNALYRYYI